MIRRCGDCGVVKRGVRKITKILRAWTFPYLFRTKADMEKAGSKWLKRWACRECANWAKEHEHYSCETIKEEKDA